MWSEYLQTILKDLPARERAIISRRHALDFVNGHYKIQWHGRELVIREETLASIGKSFNITRERVRQLEGFILRKVKESLGNQKEMFSPLKKEAEEFLSTMGGAAEENMFLGKLVGLDIAKFKEWTPAQFSERQAAAFILEFCFSEYFERVPCSDSFFSLWTSEHLAWSNFKDTLSAICKAIAAYGRPLEETELFSLVRKTLPQEIAVTDGVILGWLAMMKKVQKNTMGLWGLTTWPEIVPKTIGDRIDLVFKREKRPVHFREMTKFINELKVSSHSVSEGSVRNELISSSKYVLVGRGLYALSEWGYQPGKVREVISRVIKAENRPLTKGEIITLVLKERLVKTSTVHAVLSNKTWFEKLPSGEYTVK
jgi:hypothetical protein